MKKNTYFLNMEALSKTLNKVSTNFKKVLPNKFLQKDSKSKKYNFLYGILIFILFVIVIYQQIQISTLQWQVDYQSTYANEDSYAHRIYQLELKEAALNSDLYDLKMDNQDVPTQILYLKNKITQLEWEIRKLQWNLPR